MIQLSRHRGKTHVPASFRSPKTIKAAEKVVGIFYGAQTTGKFEWDSKAWKPAKNALKADTGGKCAYCEASTAVVAHGDVEHFRPKAIHWWLALVFDNYLFSCQICNQSFKGDQFPISGQPTASPAMPAVAPTGAALTALATTLVVDATAVTDADIRALWMAEDADLPHPYLEDPEQLFAYEADDANKEIWLRSSGGQRADRALRAAETVLGLNREDLRRQRYVSYRSFFLFRAALVALDAATRQDVEFELRTQQGRHEPFAGMKRYFARAWSLPGPL